MSNPLFSEIAKIIDCEHKNPPFEESGIPYVRTSDIGQGKIKFEKARRVSQDSYKKWTRRAVPQSGDIILTRDPPIGNVGIIPEGMAVCLGQGTVLVRPDSGRVDSSFLTYLILGREVQSIFYALASGATLPHLNLTDLREIRLPWFPHLEIQQRIGIILSTYDELIENNLRRIQLLEEMARALYREWFVHFRFPGHGDVEMVDSELGVIPEGWRTVNLSDIVKTQYGYTESTQEKEVGPKYVRGMDINKTPYIDWDAVPYCIIDDRNRMKYKLNISDILVIRMADPGKVGIIEKDIDAVFASYLIRLTIESDDLRPYFLFYTLSAEHYQNYISGASTGTTRKSASAPLITNYKITIPDSQIMDLFENSISTMRVNLNNLLNQNAILKRVRAILLPRLVSGKIDVSDLKIEIPSDTRKTSISTDQSTLEHWLEGNNEEE